MTDAKATTVLLVALLLASSFGTATVGAGSLAGDSAGNDASESAGNTGPETFHVVQGEECYEVTALGSGDETVSEFYDYRAGAGTLYGSYGEGSQAVQENQVSHVFVYEGEDGLSLVVLHDDLNRTGGGAVTFDISGLPEEREWVVEDDDYTNRDDNFDHGETSSTIDWMWGDNRTDGAAVRGLDADFEGITVEPAFGEESWASQNRSNPWPFATDEIEEWQLQSGTGEEFSLDKDEPITIVKGTCSDGSEDENEHEGEDGDDESQHDGDSSAALSVSPETVTENESVQFEASGLAEACEDATYEWDFDSDGDTDARTDDPTVSHTYDDAGSYNATVTIVHEDGTEESSSTSVEVTADDQNRVCKPAEEGEPEDGEGEDEDESEDGAGEESEGESNDEIESDGSA